MENSFDLESADFEEDQYSRLKLIPWWDQDRLSNAKIMVVGAGAIGNELIKNLTLLGIGKILIYDMDTIENTNLTRSVLYRRKDVGRYKAEVAAERAMEMNPDVHTKAFTSNIIDDATKHHMSIGKYNESQILMGYDDTITIEDCHNMSIHEIHNEIAKHHSESNSHHGKHHE